MRRLFAFSCALLLAGIFCLSQQEHVSAFWQSRDSNYNAAISSGGGSLTWNPNSTQAAVQTLSHTSPATFSVTLDVAPVSTDLIVIGVANGNGGNSPVGGITVNLSSMTFVEGDTVGVGAANSAFRSSIWTISGITTSSLSIVVTAALGGFTDIGISVGVIKNATSSTATAIGNNNQSNNSDPQTLTAAITVPSSGVGLVYLATTRNSVPSSTNSTIDTTTEISDATPWQGFFAHTTTAGSWNPSLSGTPAFAFSVPGLAAAAWH